MKNFKYILLLILSIWFQGGISGEDLWVDKNPYHPLSGITEGSVLKLEVNEPVLVEYEYERKSDETATIKITPDKSLMDFIPGAGTEKSITGTGNVKVRARGRIRVKLGVTVVRQEKGILEFEGRKILSAEDGRASQNIVISGKVDKNDVNSNRVIHSADVADLILRIQGAPVPVKKDFPMKTEPGEKPGDPAKTKAKLSDEEKQKMLLDYMNRVFGEAGME